MAYVLPTFNLTCGIYTVTDTGSVLRATCLGNLAMGRRMAWQSGIGEPLQGYFGFAPSLLVPALTDIRDASVGVLPDQMEVPHFSGRWYQVVAVDDIGKGFENEHRLVTLNKTWGAPAGQPGFHGFWPIPIP